jgi:hypothetical protein
MRSHLLILLSGFKKFLSTHYLSGKRLNSHACTNVLVMCVDKPNLELYHKLHEAEQSGYKSGLIYGLFHGAVIGIVLQAVFNIADHSPSFDSDRQPHHSVGNNSGYVQRSSESNDRSFDSASVDGVVRRVEQAGMMTQSFAGPVQQYTMLPERRYNHGIKRR